MQFITYVSSHPPFILNTPVQRNHGGCRGFPHSIGIIKRGCFLYERGMGLQPMFISSYALAFTLMIPEPFFLCFQEMHWMCQGFPVGSHVILHYDTWPFFLSEACQDAAADHCGINSGLFQPVPPSKSGPICAPYSVHSMEAHRAEKALGTVRSSSSLHWPIAWRKPAAKPALKAGGYSFKIAEDQLPAQSKPMEMALGRSKETCHCRKVHCMSGALRRSKAVGFGDFAPHSPWASCISSMPGNCNKSCKSGVLQIVTESSLDGGAGCSIMATPCTQ